MNGVEIDEKLKIYFFASQFIYKHYGFKHQTLKLVEELEELKAAIEKNDLQNILEEMADVSVLIDQFIINSQIWGKQIHKIKLEKVQRQVKRIYNERNKE